MGFQSDSLLKNSLSPSADDSGNTTTRIFLNGDRTDFSQKQKR